MGVARAATVYDKDNVRLELYGILEVGLGYLKHSYPCVTGSEASPQASIRQSSEIAIVPTTLHSTHAQIIEAAALAVVMLAVTTTFHCEALRILLRKVFGHRISLAWVVRLLVALVATHLAEVVLYAGAYAVGANVLTVGRLQGPTVSTMLDFCYLAAETYSTLGYGDVVPTGALRLLACVEALNGVLLLSLSGAFLSGLLREGFHTEIDRLEGHAGITGTSLPSPRGPRCRYRRDLRSAQAPESGTARDCTEQTVAVSTRAARSERPKQTSD
jgi:hypothetical protein